MAGRIQGICVELSGDSTKLQAALRGVNSEIRNTESQLRDCSKLLKLDPGNSELLEQKYRKLGEAVKETKEKLETLKTAAAQADQALKDGTISQQQYDGLQREIAETEQKLKSLETEYRNFGSVQAQQVAAAGKKMQELGRTVESAGRSLTTHVTVPLAAAGAAGVASFAEIDKTMQLTNKTMGNTAEESEKLGRAMKSAAANSTFGMKDAANATLNFARAGLDAEQAAAALAPAMNLAAGEGGNLDTVSAGLVATMNGFHGSFEDAERYADTFAVACNESALDVDSLSHSMSVAAPVFAAAGYEVNDAALYLGVMADAGIDADKAANSLKTGLARLVAPVGEGAKEMERLGISVTNADGSMKESVEIQKELHDKFAELSEAEQIAAASAIFGKNQMSPWLALINSAPEHVGELDAALRGCAGTTTEMAEAMMSGFGGSLEKLKSSVDVLLSSVGEALAPTVRQVADFLQGLVDAFNALSPAQQQMVVKMGLIAAAAGPLLLITGKLISAVGTIMTFAPKIVSAVHGLVGIGGTLLGGVKALWAVLAANPVGLVIAAVAALVAGFVYLWNHCEAFRQFWIGLWEGIKGAAVAAMEGLTSFLSGAWDGIRGTTEAAWNGIRDFFGGVWDGIRAVFSAALEGIGTLLRLQFAAYATLIQGVWNGLAAFFKTAWEGIKAVFSAAAEAISTGLSKAWETIRGNTTKVWNGILAFFRSIWDGIRSVSTAAATGIRSAVATAWRGIRSAVSSSMQTVRSAVTSGWSAIRGAVAGVMSAIGGVVRSGWNSVRSGVVSAGQGILGSVKSIWASVTTAVRSTMGNVLSAVVSGFSSVQKHLAGLAGQAFRWGADIIGGIVRGIWSMIGEVADAVAGVAETIWSYLHFSVPEEGPLVDYESWMPDFVEGLAKGIRKSRGMVAEAMQGLAGEMTVSPRVMMAQVGLVGAASDGLGGYRPGTGGMNGGLAFGAGGTGGDAGDIVIPVYIGSEMVDEVVVSAQQRMNLRSGGR